ncbi:MAG TPA: hypothetical protein VIG69_16255 [Candidatus Methylomirabilis sp.]|jgi:hypothetical protein
MKWSWKLGQIAGIDLYVHATFLLLLGWVGVSHWLRGGAPAAAEGVRFITASSAASCSTSWGIP